MNIATMRIGRVSTTAVVAALALLAIGCASDTPSMPKDREEAARINVQLAMDYFRQGHLQQAKDKLDKALNQEPRNAMAHATAGLLYDRLGEPEKAEKHFKRAVDISPKDPDIRNNFAVFLCRHGKYAQGIKQALAAISDPLYKTPEAALLNAGQCAHASGDFTQAEQYFRRALGVQPHFAPALLEMAGIEFDAGKYLPARGFLERYIAEEKPGPQALWLGVRIERSLGDLGAAGDFARQLVNKFPNADETKAFLETTRGAH